MLCDLPKCDQLACVRAKGKTTEMQAPGTRREARSEEGAEWKQIEETKNIIVQGILLDSDRC